MTGSKWIVHLPRMHPFIGRAIPLHPCLVIYTFERLSCEARMEKLSALNFRLVSPETWKSWHWVSGNQELPPDFHLQSWQKFQSREIKYFKYNFLFCFSSRLAWLNNGIDTSAGKYIITGNSYGERIKIVESTESPSTDIRNGMYGIAPLWCRCRCINDDVDVSMMM